MEQRWTLQQFQVVIHEGHEEPEPIERRIPRDPSRRHEPFCNILTEFYSVTFETRLGKLSHGGPSSSVRTFIAAFQHQMTQVLCLKSETASQKDLI